jgi:N-dimethylarginine dimethylaminohydrolase
MDEFISSRALHGAHYLRNNVSEYYIKPKRVVIHNSANFKALNKLTGLSNDQLRTKYLFKDIPDQGNFCEQHEAFVSQLKQRIGQVISVSEILGPSNLPTYKCYLEENCNHVYTRDSIITLPWVPDGYILGNMKAPIRQQEPIVMRKIAEILGLREIVKIPGTLFLEGGDVIPFSYDGKRVLLIGYERRTSKEALFFLRETLIRDGLLDEIIGFELAEWRINLDGGFVPIANDVAVTHPDSILGGLLLGKDCTQEIDPLSYFKELGYTLIEAEKNESIFKQVCNCFCMGERQIMAYNITNRVNQLIMRQGIEVVGIEGTELVKGTGGPRCMTRPLYL